MIHFSQPGGAGDVEDGDNIKTGILCYLSSDETEGWSWSLHKAPAGSVARLSAFKSPYPSFAPDLPGIYEIRFQVPGKKAHSTITVVAQ